MLDIVEVDYPNNKVNSALHFVRLESPYDNISTTTYTRVSNLRDVCYFAQTTTKLCWYGSADRL